MTVFVDSGVQTTLPETCFGIVRAVKLDRELGRRIAIEDTTDCTGGSENC